MKRIIITGAAGTVAQPVIEALKNKYELVLYDKNTRSLYDIQRLDVSDAKAVNRKLPEADVLIHLAATPREDDPHKIIQQNISGALHIFEAARQKGIKRVICTSSIMTYVGSYDKTAQPLNPQAHTSPTTHYALSKLYMERLGQMYSSNYGLSVICIRLGWYPRVEDKEEWLADHPEQLLSTTDCRLLFVRCVEAPDVDYAIVNGVSLGGKDRFDLDIGWRAVGYYPQSTDAETQLNHVERIRAMSS